MLTVMKDLQLQWESGDELATTAWKAFICSGGESTGKKLRVEQDIKYS